MLDRRVVIIKHWFIMSESPFQNPQLWISCSAPFRNKRHHVITGKLQDKIKCCRMSTNGNISIIETAKMYFKTLKFINGCKANNGTYKTAKIFWQPTNSFALNLHNSLVALHTNSCLIWIHRRISDALKYINNHMAHMQLKMTLMIYVTHTFLFCATVY